MMLRYFWRYAEQGRIVSYFVGEGVVCFYELHEAVEELFHTLRHLALGRLWTLAYVVVEAEENVCSWSITMRVMLLTVLSSK